MEDWKRRDNPIARLRKWMEAKGCWDEHKEKEARERIKKDVLKSFSVAEKEKKPPIRSMFEDVYEDLTPDLKEQMKELSEHLERYPNEYELREYGKGKIALANDRVEDKDSIFAYLFTTFSRDGAPALLG